MTNNECEEILQDLIHNKLAEMTLKQAAIVITALASFFIYRKHVITS